MSFNDELVFESALINLLFEKAWKNCFKSANRKRAYSKLGGYSL